MLVAFYVLTDATATRPTVQTPRPGKEKANQKKTLKKKKRIHLRYKHIGYKNVLSLTHFLHVLVILIFGCCHSCQVVGLGCRLVTRKKFHPLTSQGNKKKEKKRGVFKFGLHQHTP